MSLRVLLLHNQYRSPGGEERAVGDLATLLRQRGHRVSLLERSSAHTSGADAARGLLGGGIAPEAVAAAVKEHGADVVHAHNLHPLFGWRALAAARGAGAATVLHLHNYRLFCAIAIAYRNGHVCHSCRGRRTLPAVAHRCRGTVAESAVYAAGLALQQRRLIENAGALVAVSAAVAGGLVELGAPAERLTVLHNFVPSGSMATRSKAGEGRYALASGRLTEEKGFDTAITATAAAGVPLMLAGDGPDVGRLRMLAATIPSAEITFTGWLSAARLAELRSGAAMVLIPSRWEEPFPYAALDAMASGVPVLASDRGGLSEAVGRSSVLPPDEHEAWSQAIVALMGDCAQRTERGEAALRRAAEQFGEDRYLEGLLRIYNAACAPETS